MKTKIVLLKQPLPVVIPGTQMVAGDYGVIVEVDKDHRTRENLVGQRVYRHSREESIMDLDNPPISWSDGRGIKVELLCMNESIEITRIGK